MNKKVHIRHPVTGGEADVFKSALPHLLPGGWEVVGDTVPAAPAPAGADQATGGTAAEGAAEGAQESSDGEQHADVAPTTTEAARPRRKSKE